MDITILPRQLSGSVTAPSSKSFVHRQMIAAALSERPALITLRGLSQDIAATAGCITALGGRCRVNGPYRDAGYVIAVEPIDREDLPANALLNAGESGSTARFMLPVAAALYAAAGRPCSFALTGRGRLPGRPMADLANALRANGAVISADALPMTVGGTLRPGIYTLPGNVSSQYITGLQLALPLLGAASEIRLSTPPASAGYLAITARVLQEFGVALEATPTGWRVPAGRYRGLRGITAEGDWSNAAFWLAADALMRQRGGAGVSVRGLNEASVQGDRAVLEAIAAITAPGDTVIDIDPIPDLAPILAVLAAGQDKTTTFAGAARLRLKESDRIATTCDMLQALGGRAEAGPDSFAVHGAGALGGGSVDGAGDHRIVMAAAVASCLCANPVGIRGAQAADKSYPEFFDDFKRLGGIVMQD